MNFASRHLVHDAWETAMQMKYLAATAAALSILASPLAAQATPITFGMAATIFGTDGAPPAGQLSGSIDYDPETGVFSAAHLQVVLNGTGDIFELTTIDPEFNAIGKETKPIVVLGDVKGESSEKDHKGFIEMQIPKPPVPGGPIGDFSGYFVDSLPGVDPVRYSIRGTATLAVPEPATYALLAIGLAAAALTRRFRQRIPSRSGLALTL